jgi:hypothetical protein
MGSGRNGLGLGLVVEKIELNRAIPCGMKTSAKNWFMVM